MADLGLSLLETELNSFLRNTVKASALGRTTACPLVMPGTIKAQSLLSSLFIPWIFHLRGVFSLNLLLTYAYYLKWNVANPPVQL